MSKYRDNIESKKNSTLAIDALTSQKLNLFCKRHGMTKKEFISVSLDYFERTGINPHSNEVNTDLHQIHEKLNTIVQLQADSAIKLTNISEYQKTTTKLLEEKQETVKKKWWKL